MTPEELEAAARALFPASPNAGLADALRINPRTMRRMRNGDEPIPENLAAEIRVLLAQAYAREVTDSAARREAIAAAARKISAAS